MSKFSSSSSNTRYEDVETKLLCTFTSDHNLDDTIEAISMHYDLLYDKIFVLQNAENESELFCTYNIDDSRDTNRFHNTISIHRKKDTNTIYTINALNKLIIELNDGQLDESYIVPWENYQNMILFTVGDRLRMIPTEIYDIRHTTV